MKHLHLVLIASLVSILALAGCNNAQQSTTQTSPAVSPASAVAVTQQTSKEGFNGLLGVVSNTKAAIEAGNFAKAKEEFNKFEDNWKKVEDGVKAKSRDSYKAIEDNMDKVMGELKASAPNKVKVLAALQSLEKNITSVAKL